jgi:hypothetical protein
MDLLQQIEPGVGVRLPGSGEALEGRPEEIERLLKSAFADGLRGFYKPLRAWYGSGRLGWVRHGLYLSHIQGSRPAREFSYTPAQLAIKKCARLRRVRPGAAGEALAGKGDFGDT